MHMFDKKKAVTVILSKMRPDGSTSEVNKSEESGEQNEYTACAEDILEGIESKSINKLAAALKAFHELVKSEDLEQDARE